MKVVCAVPNGPKTLDFAGVANILNVMGNGTLSIKQLNVRGIASRHLLGAKYVPDLRAVDFPFWPTVIMQPDARVSPLLELSHGTVITDSAAHAGNNAEMKNNRRQAACSLPQALRTAHCAEHPEEHMPCLLADLHKVT
jgi:hypothetical protein